MDVSNEEDQENNTTMKRTPQQRKISYRHLMDKIEHIPVGDSGLHLAAELRDVLCQANSLDAEVKIEEKVEYADETLLDCLLVSSASSLLKKCVDEVDVFSSTYEQSEFASKIINYVKTDEADDNESEESDNVDLLKLLEEVRSIIPDVPDYSYVYGAYDQNKLPQPKPRKERQRIVEKLQKREPEKIKNVVREDGVEEIVSVLHDVLVDKFVANDRQPIKYYDYIIDTDNFANTVQNMFYFAFLIRDGKAQFDLDSNREPVIKPINKKQLTEFRNSGGVNTQIISNISIDQWRKFRKRGYIQLYQEALSIK